MLRFASPAILDRARTTLSELLLAPGAGAVELSTNARFAGRVRRLAWTAAVALGLILIFALRTRPDAHGAIHIALALGWILMPLTLLASLARPRLRYALTLPAFAVGIPLLVLALNPAVDARPSAVIGWWSVTAGIWLGGLLGSWFWYRLAPVPRWLHDPFSAGRWMLIAVHIALIVGGLLVLATSALATSGTA